MNRWPLISTLAVASFATVLMSCAKSEAPKPATATAKARTVKTARVESRPMERAVIVTGSLAAQEQATLSVKVAGRLQAIDVDLGSAVKKGDLIAQIEKRDYELRSKQAAATLAQSRALLGLPPDGLDDQVDPEKTSIVKQAKAVLEEATKNRARVTSLSEEGISSKSERDTVEATYVVALNKYEGALDEARTRQAMLAQRRAELEIAQQQLADTTIRAPFDGVVQLRTATAGEYLAEAAPVVTLVRTDPLRLRLEVPERESLFVRAGQRVYLGLEGDTNEYSGKITRLSPAINEQNRMLLVEADVPNRGSLRPGQFVRAQIITDERDRGLTVPPSALITFAGLEKVVVVQDRKALEKTVMTGRRAANWIEIVLGVKAGEEVVLEPGSLRTGESVAVVRSESSGTTATADALSGSWSAPSGKADGLNK
jgi:RND family efflux transporter MFP subunit